MKLVIAGNIRQFERYCQEQRLSSDEATYVSLEVQLCGYKNPEIILYGSWWENPAANAARRLREESRKPGGSKLVLNKKTQRIKKVKINRWKRLIWCLRNVNK